MNTKKLKHGAVIIIMSVMLAACGQNDAPAGESTGAPNTPVNPPANQEQPAGDNEEIPDENAAETPDETDQAEPDWGDEGLPPTALESAKTVMNALKSGNMETVSNWAHKDKSVRFSAHGNVDAEADQSIEADAIANLVSDDEVRIWHSGSNGTEAIEMTYADYHKQYVYDQDYASITPTENETQADSIGNLLEVYPAKDYAYVEYYVDNDNGWSLIRLVFEKVDQDHALAAIIHDEQAS